MSQLIENQNTLLSEKSTKRLAWALVLIGSLSIFLLPIDAIEAYFGSETWVLVALALFLLIVIVQFLGTCLFIFSYRAFFKTFKGTLLYFIWLTVGLRLMAYLDTISSPSGLITRLGLLNSSWLFVVPFALGLALLTYLTYQDKAMLILAATFLVYTWGIAAYIYYRGPLQLFHDAALAQLPFELWTVTCFWLWVLIIAPFSFLGHSLRLIAREWSPKDMDRVPPPQGDKK